MKRFSDMTKETVIEDTDYVPFIDTSESDVDKQNKTALYGTIKEYMLRDISDAEEQREKSEQERQAAEQIRANSETERETAETSRASAEEERASAETARVAAEKARASAESSSASAESTRASSENARVSAESSRRTAENARVSAETARSRAESDRASAEAARVTAEQERADAESRREDLEYGYVVQAKSWAVGPSGTEQQGTDEDNAKYWADQAASKSGVHVATRERLGIVKPGEGIDVNDAGTLYVATIKTWGDLKSTEKSTTDGSTPASGGTAEAKPATKESAGIVIIGDGIDVATDGTISVEKASYVTDDEVLNMLSGRFY